MPRVVSICEWPSQGLRSRPTASFLRRRGMHASRARGHLSDCGYGRHYAAKRRRTGGGERGSSHATMGRRGAGREGAGGRAGRW
eukprot:6180589-Pleurochrysis_carterae.AAC.2